MMINIDPYSLSFVVSFSIYIELPHFKIFYWFLVAFFINFPFASKAFAQLSI